MGLQDNARNEQVSQLSLREPVTATSDENIRTIITRMRGRRLGCTVIVDSGRNPVGMFTEGMLTQLIVHDPGAVDEPVKKHMADRWPWLKATDPIADAVDALQAKNVRFLCVVDDEGRLVGLAGQKGLMEYVADHFPGQVMVQRIGGTRFPDKREGA